MRSPDSIWSNKFAATTKLTARSLSGFGAYHTNVYSYNNPIAYEQTAFDGVLEKKHS